MRAKTLLLAAALLASAAAGQDGEDVKEVDIDEAQGPPASDEACFNVRDARSFHAFTDRHVYVEGRRDEHYLLTMWGVCPGLRDSFRVRLSNDFSRVCSNGQADITYRGIGGDIESCRIRLVERVESKADAEALVRGETRREE